MKYASLGSKISAIVFLLLPFPTSYAADSGLSGTLAPSGQEAAAEAKAADATRIPRRDTRSPLFCSAADSAPQIAPRVAEGSCRNHTQEHHAEAIQGQNPWTPTTDIRAITGR